MSQLVSIIVTLCRLATLTKDKGLAETLSVAGELTVFKMVAEEDENEMQDSPEFPITLKLTDMASLKR